MSYRDAINIVQIFVSAILILVILLQVKGSGFGSALGSTSGQVYRTKRGVEKTLFQATIVLTAVFLLMSVLSVLEQR